MSANIQSAGDLTAGPSLVNRFARKNTAQTVDKAANDFQGMFMAQMLQPMFDTVGVDPIFGGGHGEEMMRGFLVQEYGKVLAKNANFNIATAVRSEMLRAQEASQTNKLNNGATNVIGSVQ